MEDEYWRFADMVRRRYKPQATFMLSGNHGGHRPPGTPASLLEYADGTGFPKGYLLAAVGVRIVLTP